MKIFLNISVPDCYELVYIKQDSKTTTVQTDERTTTSKPDETETYHSFIDIFLIVSHQQTHTMQEKLNVIYFVY